MKQQTRLLLTLTPDFGINNNSLTYVCGTAEAIITLNRDFKIADDYSFFLYNDEQMLLDFAETGTTGVERNGRSMRMNFSQPMVWIPGKYFLLMRCDDGKTLCFDILLDEHATFSASAPRLCHKLSDEDLLSGRLCMQKHMWFFVSQLPGMRQFRQQALRWARLEELNMVCNEFVKTGELIACNNFIVYTRGNDLVKDAVTYFWDATRMRGELEWLDCSTLYDTTNGNPYERLGEVDENNNKVRCLTNLSALLDNGGKVIVKKLRSRGERFILVGSKAEVENLLEQNPSWRELFPQENTISVEPASAKELILYYMQRIVTKNYFPSSEATDQIGRMLTKAHQQGSVSQWTTKEIDDFVYKNVRPHYLERLTRTVQGGSYSIRDMQLLPEDTNWEPLFCKTCDYTDTLKELNAMIGLDDIKQSLTTIANNTHLFVERQRLGLHNSHSTTHHAIFMGSPGTGKTTVAKMLGKIYHSLGLLSKGEVVCVDRTRIIGRYIGETEENMKQILQEARGNVLFVDEAYTLYGGTSDNDYGRRAVECLLNVLTQKNADMLIIFAGYQEEMDRLMSMNPGLVGRFPYKFLFKDYSADELMQIARSLLAKDDYVLTDEAAALLRQAITEAKGQHSKNFGNARWVEHFVQNGIIPALADRLATTVHSFEREVYQRIEVADVEKAYDKFSPKTIELKPRRQVGFSA